MEIVSIDREYLLKRALTSKYIGKGTTSICFLQENGQVLKIYLPTPRKKLLFDAIDMKEHLTFLGEVSNEIFIGPNRIFLVDGKVGAVELEYVDAKTIAKIDPKTAISDLISALHRIIFETYEISRNHLRLGDVHPRNVLFDKCFYIIDLDDGLNAQILTTDELFQVNISAIIYALLRAVFQIPPFHKFGFTDSELAEYYRLTITNNFQYYDNLFTYLGEICNCDTPTIKDLRTIKKKILTEQPISRVR